MLETLDLTNRIKALAELREQARAAVIDDLAELTYYGWAQQLSAEVEAAIKKTEARVGSLGKAETEAGRVVDKHEQARRRLLADRILNGNNEPSEELQKIERSRSEAEALHRTAKQRTIEARAELRNLAALCDALRRIDKPIAPALRLALDLVNEKPE